MLRIYEGEIYNIELAGFDFATFLEQIEQNPDGKNMIFVFTENHRIIAASTYYGLVNNEIIAKTFSVENDYFAEARDFCLNNKIYELAMFPVLDSNGDLKFLLYYEENNIKCFSFPRGKQGWLNYGRYDLIKNVADLDFSFIDRFDVFVFYSVEEYTYAIANLIKNARSDKRIIFLDDKAEEIWGGGVEVYTRKDVFKLELQKCCWITSDNQLFEDSRLPECRANVYCSLNVMSSLMWCAKKESFGEKNADDTILILDFQNKGAGLVDIMLFTCCYKEVAKQRGWKIVIDYSSKNNQYVINEGENMWEYFFESISDLPVQDAYQSKTVIRASTNNMPLAYGYELLYIREFLDVNYMKKIKFNCQTIEQINSLLPNEFREGKRILGLIMRGTDYRKEAVTLRKEQVVSADIDRVINKCSYMMELWDCDFVFVATEDSEYYSILKEKIGNRMLDISQKRVSHDYSVGYRNTADLLDIEDGRDFGRRYLATICALSKCNLMISNMNNGTFRAACNLNDGKYEWCEIISKK